MINIQINGKDYRHAEAWNEIPLSLAMKLVEVKLKAVEDSFDLFKQYEQVERLFWLFLQADPIPVHPTRLVYHFWKYMYQFVADLHANVPKSYVPEMISEFSHNGKRYLMPESLVIDDDTVVLQHDTDTRRFIEASNLLKQYAELKDNGIKSMPLFIATVVKESKDELFDEATVVTRAKEFKDLPMSVVWEVFFCISQLMHKRINDILQSMREDIVESKVRKRKDLASKLGLLQQRKAELWAELKRLTR